MSGEMFLLGTVLGGAVVLLYLAYLKMKDWFNY